MDIDMDKKMESGMETGIIQEGHSFDSAVVCFLELMRR